MAGKQGRESPPHIAPVLRILGCARARLTRWYVRPEGRPFWRFYWNADPGAAIVFRRETFELDDRRIFAIPPNTPFGVRLQGTVHHLFAHFLLGYPYDAIRPRIIASPVTGGLRKRLAQLNRQIGERRQGAPASDLPHAGLGRSGRLHLSALIAYVLGEVAEQDWPQGPTDARIRRALQRIDAEGPAPKNVALAVSASMNTNAFIRLFRQEVGEPPQAYAVKRRLERACVMLTHGDETIERIAERCGYCDRNYFSAVFAKRFGIGPASYRRAYAWR
ncbi:MAG: helix-turn-helix transcriptional regulator [Kiritimatiellae bacterium]|nr:helix-turn-helix transcriptional regulator [Kiritimatiellia bacterium]